MKNIPMKKRSKREQKAFHAAQRGSWNGVNPISRIVPDKKKYDRKKWKQAEHQLDGDLPVLFHRKKGGPPGPHFRG